MAAMRSSGVVSRLAAASLLCLVACFALTAVVDPCYGEAVCGDGPCHLLCLDGCTATPVPAIHIETRPAEAGSASALRAPLLVPSCPDLDADERPPRLLA
jgi:hypothetical protein